MTSARPRALFLAPLMPAETGNGLAMRTGLFLEAMAAVADVDLVILPVAGRAEPSPLVARLGIVPRIIETAGRADTQFALLSMLRDPAARLAAFRAYGRGSRHAAMSAPVLAELRTGTGDYDLVHAERLYLLDAARAAGAPRLSLDLDEDDAAAWRQSARNRADERERAAWMEAEADAEDRLLAKLAATPAHVFISNALDRRRVRARHPALAPEIIANAVTIPAAPRRTDDGRTLLFVGNFGYPPNSEGILWFAAQIWPQLAARGLRLRLAGANMPAAIEALADLPGVEILGYVDDLAGVYAEASLAILPLQSGGGTRIKLLEAAARGVPVVSTAIGAGGLGLSHDAYWRADSTSGFAAAVGAALADPAERAARAARLRAFVVAHHDREAIRERLSWRFAEILVT